MSCHSNNHNTMQQRDNQIKRNRIYTQNFNNSPQSIQYLEELNNQYNSIIDKQDKCNSVDTYNMKDQATNLQQELVQNPENCPTSSKETFLKYELIEQLDYSPLLSKSLHYSPQKLHSKSFDNVSAHISEYQMKYKQKKQMCQNIIVGWEHSQKNNKQNCDYWSEGFDITDYMKQNFQSNKGRVQIEPLIKRKQAKKLKKR